MNGKKRGHVKLGDAQLYYHNGRAYYSAFGKSVWKKAPVANVPKMNTEGNDIKIGGMNASQFHKLNGNEKIAVGLGHLLSEIIKE